MSSLRDPKLAEKLCGLPLLSMAAIGAGLAAMPAHAGLSFLPPPDLKSETLAVKVSIDKMNPGLAACQTFGGTGAFRACVRPVFGSGGAPVGEFGSVEVTAIGARIAFAAMEAPTLKDGPTLPGPVLDFKVGDEIDATDFGFTNQFAGVYSTNPSPFGLQPGQITFYGFRYTEGNDNYYGYLEVARGSVNVNQIVFNSNPNQGLTVGQASVVPTPDGTVPEPGSLALLAAGALGVAALRRRKQARAELAAA